MSNAPGSVFSSNYTDSTCVSQKQALKHGFGKVIWRWDKPMSSPMQPPGGLIWLRNRVWFIQSYKGEIYPFQGLP